MGVEVLDCSLLDRLTIGLSRKVDNPIGDLIADLIDQQIPWIARFSLEVKTHHQ